MTLLRAALQLGAAHGFASLGLREVARAANIAPTSFYRHFADMTDLGLSVVDELVTPLLRGIAERVRDGDARATSAGLADGLLAAVEQDPELSRFVLAERVGASASLRSALREKVETLTRALQPFAKHRARTTDSVQARHAPQLAVALLMEGLARALDAPAKEKRALHDWLVESLASVLDPARSAAEKR